VLICDCPFGACSRATSQGPELAVKKALKGPDKSAQGNALGDGGNAPSINLQRPVRGLND
jgi:hypothetical protein